MSPLSPSSYHKSPPGDRPDASELCPAWPRGSLSRSPLTRRGQNRPRAASTLLPAALPAACPSAEHSHCPGLGLWPLCCPGLRARAPLDSRRVWGFKDWSPGAPLLRPQADPGAPQGPACPPLRCPRACVPRGLLGSGHRVQRVQPLGHVAVEAGSGATRSPLLLWHCWVQGGGQGGADLEGGFSGLGGSAQAPPRGPWVSLPRENGSAQGCPSAP